MYAIDAQQGTIGTEAGLSQAERAMTYQKYVGKNWVSLPVANTSYSVLNSTKKSRIVTATRTTTTVKKSSSVSTVRIGGSSGFGGGGAGGR
jgi:uncharacterized membrane protein